MTQSQTGLSIALKDHNSSFLPGQIVEGVASWNLSDAPKIIVVSLAWKTQGKGNEDSVVVASEETPEHPPLAGNLPFHFQLPLEPCSFHGQLVSVIWSIEVKAPKTDLIENQRIILSPTGQEISPSPVPDLDA